MDRTAIIQKIKIRMDELTPLGENLSHPFDNSLNSILDESHRQILNQAPSHLLPQSEIPSSVIYDTVNDFAYILVPEKFIRIGFFKFSGWDNPATKFISIDHPEYKAIQLGIGSSNVVFPLVVMVDSMQTGDTVPKKYLRCYNVVKLQDVDPKEYLFYIQEGDVDSLSDMVSDALAWLAVSKLMQAFEMQGFKVAEERYKEFLISNTR